MRSRRRNRSLFHRRRIPRSCLQLTRRNWPPLLFPTVIPPPQRVMMHLPFPLSHLSQKVTSFNSFFGEIYCLVYLIMFKVSVFFFPGVLGATPAIVDKPRSSVTLRKLNQGSETTSPWCRLISEFPQVKFLASSFFFALVGVCVLQFKIYYLFYICAAEPNYTCFGYKFLDWF